MATNQPSCQCECPSNSDSALSTSANILSILTFAYVFILSASYTLAIRWDAVHNLAVLRHEIVMTHQRCEATAARIESSMEHSKREGSRRRVAVIEKHCSALEDEIEKWLKDHEKSAGRWYLVLRYVRSIWKTRTWRHRYEDAELEARKLSSVM